MARSRRKAWWGGLRWTAIDAAQRWGLTPDGWRAVSVRARYEMTAKCRAEDTVRAWNSMTDKERGRAIAMWHEWKARRRKKDDGGQP